MALVDVHCHLEGFDDLDKVIKNAKENGLKAIICNGIDVKTNRFALDASAKYDIVKASLGIYPIELLSMQDDEIERELCFIEQNKEHIVAIGEVGLDFKEDENNHERQMFWFRKIIELSKKIEKPLSIHSRKAEAEVIKILEELGAKKVHMHCFSGNLKLAKRVIDNGWFISIPTNVAFSEHFQYLAKITPLKQLLTETDSPFLSPIKGSINEPSNIKHAVKKIAQIKGITEQDCENIVFMNYQSLFM